MTKILSALVILTIVLGALYLFLLSPSGVERNADSKYQDKDFRASILLYTRALAENRLSFKAERLLFKLGNAYRLGGQRERALDFYIKILRDNPDSVYRERIQGLLKVETEEIQGLAEVESTYTIDLSSFQGPVPEDIVKLKSQRDLLYLQLVKAISSSRGGLGYELLSAYKRFQELDEGYQQRRSSDLTTHTSIIRRKAIRNLALVGMADDAGAGLKKEESVYTLAITQKDSIQELLQSPSNFPLDAVFVRVHGIPSTKFHLNASRLFDLFEKAKIFLLFDDNGTEPREVDLGEYLQKNTFVLECEDDKECRMRILEALHLRSIWQSNG